MDEGEILFEPNKSQVLYRYNLSPLSMKKLREGGSETQRPAQAMTSVEKPTLNPLLLFVMG